MVDQPILFSCIFHRYEIRGTEQSPGLRQTSSNLRRYTPRSPSLFVLFFFIRGWSRHHQSLPLAVFLLGEIRGDLAELSIDATKTCSAQLQRCRQEHVLCYTLLLATKPAQFVVRGEGWYSFGSFL